MERVAGTEGFDIAKQRFKLIGITGQTYSGQSSFFNGVKSQHHLGIADYSGVYEDLVMAYLEGDEAAVNWYTVSGTKPPYREPDGNIVFNSDNEDCDHINEAEFLLDTDKMHFLRSNSFKRKMLRLSDSLKKVAEENPYITKDMAVPIFVDLPMCGEVDYFDYVEELIVITRPRETADPNAWYMRHILGDHSPNQDNYIDLCAVIETSLHILETDDYAFDQIMNLIGDRVEFIHNGGTYEEYLEKCRNVLDRYADVCQDAIKPLIDKKIKEIL